MRVTWFPRGRSVGGVAAIASVVLLSGCASHRGAAPNKAGDVEVGTSPNAFFAQLWQQPVADGVTVESLDGQGLAYVPDAPKELGPAVRTVLTAEGTVKEPYREIGFVYDHANYGQFIVLERIVNEAGAVAEIQELSGHAPGCSATPVNEDELGKGAYAEACTSGDGSLETLNDGTPALLFVGDNTTFVAWLETLTYPSAADEAAVTGIVEFAKPALYVQVIGPSPDFTKIEALAVANSF